MYSSGWNPGRSTAPLRWSSQLVMRLCARNGTAEPFMLHSVLTAILRLAGAPFFPGNAIQVHKDSRVGAGAAYQSHGGTAVNIDGCRAIGVGCGGELVHEAYQSGYSIVCDGCNSDPGQVATALFIAIYEVPTKVEIGCYSKALAHL
ncbi:hypothetical protein PspLS_04652 [Pyricularia sp. CBS 133598]|nr:hypothetical protein PspLS_04652 [Pyricularia sp. CBS 133598]